MALGLYLNVTREPTTVANPIVKLMSLQAPGLWAVLPGLSEPSQAFAEMYLEFELILKIHIRKIHF